MPNDPTTRRAIASEHMASLNRHSRELEAEGDYRGAAEAVDVAADWDFWATYGVDRATWDAANPLD